jgi:hypothetical protein
MSEQELVDVLGTNGQRYHDAVVNGMAVAAVENGEEDGTDAVRQRVRGWLCMDIRQLAALRYSRRNGDAYTRHTAIGPGDDPLDALGTMAFYALLEDVNDAIMAIREKASENTDD